MDDTHRIIRNCLLKAQVAINDGILTIEDNDKLLATNLQWLDTNLSAIITSLGRT